MKYLKCICVICILAIIFIPCIKKCLRLSAKSQYCIDKEKKKEYYITQFTYMLISVLLFIILIGILSYFTS